MSHNPNLTGVKLSGARGSTTFKRKNNTKHKYKLKMIKKMITAHKRKPQQSTSTKIKVRERRDHKVSRQMKTKRV